MSGWIWDQHCLAELAALLERQADADGRLADQLAARSEASRQEAARVREMLAEAADVADVAHLAGSAAVVRRERRVA